MESFLDIDVAVAGLLIMFAVVVAGLGFAYIADEEATGRRIDWLEEPLATPEVSAGDRAVELRKAA